MHYILFLLSRGDRVAAQKCPPLAMAIALDIRKGISHENSTFIEFPVIEIASAIGWNSGVVKYQLKQLEWTTGLLKYFINSIFKFQISRERSFFRSRKW